MWTLRFGCYTSQFCDVNVYRLTYERWCIPLYYQGDDFDSLLDRLFCNLNSSATFLILLVLLIILVFDVPEAWMVLLCSKWALNNAENKSAFAGCSSSIESFRVVGVRVDLNSVSIYSRLVSKVVTQVAAFAFAKRDELHVLRTLPYIYILDK